MTQTEVEDRINEVIAEARDAGVDVYEILSALEIVSMSLEEEAEEVKS